MNEFLFDVAMLMITVVILPLTSLIGGLAVSFITTKLKREKDRLFLNKLSKIVLDAVKTIFQTYVDNMKKNDFFDEKAQKEAFIRAKKLVYSQMNDELKQYLELHYGDLENIISIYIESTINTLKNNNNAR